MSETTHSELAIGLAAIQSNIQKRLGGALSPHGISFTEFLVLRQLVQAPDNKMRRIDLAEKIGLSASGVTRLLNPMEKIGLVLKEANARDARVSLVGLSDTGKRIFEEAAISFEHAANSIFSPITSKNLSVLSKLVTELQ